MATQLQSLADYYRDLMGADFDYVSIDSYSAYCRARDEIARLEAQAKTSEQHHALFEAFRVHHDSKERRLYNKAVIVPPLPEKPVGERV